MTTIRQWAPAAAMGAAVVVLGLLAAFLATGVNPSGLAPQSVHPIAVVLLLSAIGAGLGWWAARGDRVVFAVILAGMAAKVAGTIVRVELTADAGDASFYDSSGRRIAGWIAEGGLQADDPRLDFRGDGTNNLALVVGRIYHVLGSDIVVGFAMFSFFSFLGSLLIYRAVSGAVPDLATRRYACLLFLLPSMLFWPSTIGKDTWMVLAIGLVVHGVSGATGPAAPLHILETMLGVLMAGWIRPHVAALLTLCVVVSVVWSETRRSGSGRLRRVVLAVVGLVLLVGVLAEVERFFGTDGLDLGAVLDETESTTAEGDSQFDARRATDPVGLLLGIPGVMLRPFPHETSSVLQLATSFEGIAIAMLSVHGWRRFRNIPALFRRSAMVRFVFVYVLGFVIAFSVVSNFGILARQRVQVWPLFLVLLCLPPWRREPIARTSASGRLSESAQSGP